MDVWWYMLEASQSQNIPMVQTNNQVHLHTGIYMNEYKEYKGINIVKPQAIHKSTQKLFQTNKILAALLFFFFFFIQTIIIFNGSPRWIRTSLISEQWPSCISISPRSQWINGHKMLSSSFVYNKIKLNARSIDHRHIDAFQFFNQYRILIEQVRMKRKSFFFSYAAFTMCSPSTINTAQRQFSLRVNSFVTLFFLFCLSKALFPIQ